MNGAHCTNPETPQAGNGLVHGNGSSPGGWLPVALTMAGLVVGLALPSCGVPISVGYETPEGRISYSAKRGIAVDWSGSK